MYIVARQYYIARIYFTHKQNGVRQHADQNGRNVTENFEYIFKETFGLGTNHTCVQLTTSQKRFRKVVWH